MMNDEHSDARPEASNVSKFSGSYALFSDAKLVAMVRAGDEHAFEQLMQRYLPIVTAYLWGKMWERGEIEDLTQ